MAGKWTAGRGSTTRAFFAGALGRRARLLYDEAAHVRNDRAVTDCWVPNGSRQCAIFGINDAGTVLENRLPSQLSAGSRPTNAGASMDGYVFWSDSVNHLYMADLKNPATSGAVDMGILTLPP